MRSRYLALGVVEARRFGLPSRERVLARDAADAHAGDDVNLAPTIATKEITLQR